MAENLRAHLPLAAGTRRVAGAATEDAVRTIRDRGVLGKMLDTFDVLYGMLAARQQTAVTPAERLAFAQDDGNVKLAATVIDSGDKVLKYGVPKLSSIDYVGDVPKGPTQIDNRFVFQLNVGNDPGRPVQINGGGERPAAAAAAAGIEPPAGGRFTLDVGAAEGSNDRAQDDDD